MAGVEEAFARLSAAAPKGWRVELVEGEIHVTPPGDGAHAEHVSEISGQAHDRHPDRSLRHYTGLGLTLPGVSPCDDHVIPDLVIAPKGSFRDKEEWHEPGAVLMTVEVTSDATAVNDRVRKLRGYARAGVPVYVLVDREEGETVVCSAPEDDRYTRKASCKIGLPVPLPEPLGFELDTAEF